MPMPRAGEGIWLWVLGEALAGRGCALAPQGIRDRDHPSALEVVFEPLLCFSQLLDAGCWHSPGPPKNTSGAKDAPAGKQRVGDGSDGYLSSGLALRGA